MKTKILLRTITKRGNLVLMVLLISLFARFEQMRAQREEFSPPGKRFGGMIADGGILFTGRSSSGIEALYLLTPFSDLVPLTLNGMTCTTPAVSRAGDRVALSCREDGSFQLKWGWRNSLRWLQGDFLRMAQEPLPVCAGLNPAFSHDGQIIFFDAEEGISSMPFDGTGRRVILPNPNHFQEGLPDISPDGRYMAFVSNRDRVGIDVYVMELKTGGIRRVTFDGSVLGGPRWSPDGQTLAFTSLRTASSRPGISLISVSTGRVTVLTDQNDSCPVWAPEGRTLFFISTRDHNFTEIFSMDAVSGGNVEQKTRSRWLKSALAYLPSTYVSGRWY